jgi:hypothetical protein
MHVTIKKFFGASKKVSVGAIGNSKRYFTKIKFKVNNKRKEVKKIENKLNKNCSMTKFLQFFLLMNEKRSDKFIEL